MRYDNTTNMPVMSEAAAYEFLRRALALGGEKLAKFSETEAADVILWYATFKPEETT